MGCGVMDAGHCGRIDGSSFPFALACGLESRFNIEQSDCDKHQHEEQYY